MLMSLWRQIGLLLLLLNWGVRLSGASWIETTERWLSYDVGNLVIKPQLGLTTKFTDNVFYGNDSVATKFYVNEIRPYDVTIPGLGTFTLPGRTNLQVFPGGVTVATNVFIAPNGVPVVQYGVQIPEHTELINGVATQVPQRTVTSTLPGATTISTLTVPVRPEESEMLFIASPGIDFQYGQTGLNTITVGYAYDQISYINNPRFDTTQHRADVKVDLKLGRFTISGTDTFHLLSSFLSGGNSSVTNQVNRTIWNDNYRITYDATAKTDLYLTVNHSRYDYDQGVFIYDSETVRGALGVSHDWTQRLRAFTEFEYGQSFVSPNVATQPASPDSSILGGFVGLRGEFTPRITGSLKVGYENRSFAGTFAPGDEPATVSSPAVVADITYAAGVRTFFRLAYTRSTDVSPQFAKQSYVFDRVQLTMNQFLGNSGKWLLSANMGYTLGDFSETPGTNLARSDKSFEAALRLSYQPRPWLTAMLGYEYENFNTAFAEPTVARSQLLIDYQVNSLTLSLNIGY
jgi:hypothetical protein